MRLLFHYFVATLFVFSTVACGGKTQGNNTSQSIGASSGAGGVQAIQSNTGGSFTVATSIVTGGYNAVSSFGTAATATIPAAGGATTGTPVWADNFR